uniref:Uncharacterized protein n=1 Tax=Arundo donax TaxID=35708 RepID=A0A0A8Y7N9_ARUDO
MRCPYPLLPSPSFHPFPLATHRPTHPTATHTLRRRQHSTPHSSLDGAASAATWCR